MLRRYLQGIIGGILGGAIASIPWIIFYVYGNKIISPLTIIIAVGALKGYKVAKGPINRSLFSIVAVIAISCVTIATLVIIPLLLIIQSKVQITLGELYTISTFTSTMLQDYLLALIFTLIGISAVIVMIKEQISDSKPKAIGS